MCTALQLWNGAFWRVVKVRVPMTSSSLSETRPTTSAHATKRSATSTRLWLLWNDIVLRAANNTTQRQRRRSTPPTVQPRVSRRSCVSWSPTRSTWSPGRWVRRRTEVPGYECSSRRRCTRWPPCSSTAAGWSPPVPTPASTRRHQLTRRRRRTWQSTWWPQLGHWRRPSRRRVRYSRAPDLRATRRTATKTSFCRRRLCLPSPSRHSSAKSGPSRHSSTAAVASGSGKRRTEKWHTKQERLENVRTRRKPSCFSSGLVVFLARCLVRHLPVLNYQPQSRGKHQLSCHVA